MEQLLHYAWKHKIFPLTELRTTTGLLVEVIDPGLPNTNAGPDFFNAKIKIDGTLWVGNVEIHVQSSDWKRHGHHTDKAYDSVILHVAGKVDTELYRTTGEAIQQLQFACPDHVRLLYDELKQTDLRPRCYALIPSMSALTIHSWFTALQVERLEQKTNQIIGRLKQRNNHWEDVFFITLSRNFGFGINGDAFEAWANLLSLRAIDKHRDNLLQIEAMFMGQAGLLEETISDPYYEALQKEFHYLSCKFDLRRMDATQWRFLRTRPGNFPHIRLAQLAWLYHHEQALLSRITETETLKEIKGLIGVDTSEYWKTHYIFGKESESKAKTISLKSLNLVVINTVVPFLYAYGLHRSDERLCDRALRLLEEIPAENNYIIRAWDGAGVPINNAADSQALIQLQKNYCDVKKCLHCRFGYEYLKKR